MLAPSPPDHELPQGAAGTASPPSSRLRALASAVVCRPRFWAVVLLLGLVALGAALIGPHIQAWYHFRAARSELQHWHNPQAIRHLKVCLRIWPHDPDVKLLAARSARRTRAYGEAEQLLEMYQQARGLDEACSLEQFLLSAERGLDQVVELCWRYVDQGHPETPLILEALTRGFLRQYRLGEARLSLKRWRELQPDNPQAYCLEGLLYLDYAHSQTQAIECFRRAVDLDEEHEAARQGLAVALLSNRKYTEAIPHLEFLQKRQPDNLSVQVGLAEAYDSLGDDVEATRWVDSVLARQPEFAPALALRGRIALNNGQPQEAERWLREAVRLNPIEHRARYGLILCLNQNGKEEEARKFREQFAQLEEDLTRFNEIVTRELAQKPRDPALHCTIGQLLLRTGQSEEGLRWLQSALRLDPRYAPARKAVEDYKAKGKPAARQAEKNP